jgi:hypothetical protein
MTRAPSEHEETKTVQPLVAAAERVGPEVIFGSISEIEYNEEGHRDTNPVIREQEMRWFFRP